MKLYDNAHPRGRDVGPVKVWRFDVAAMGAMSSPVPQEGDTWKSMDERRTARLFGPRMAACHPMRRREARGLCHACYEAARIHGSPEMEARTREQNRRRARALRARRKEQAA